MLGIYIADVANVVLFVANLVCLGILTFRMTEPPKNA